MTKATGKVKGRPRKYPWLGWFSKRSFTLRRGKHYTVYTPYMRAFVRRRAKQLGVKVELQEPDEETIKVRVLTPLSPALARIADGGRVRGAREETRGATYQALERLASSSPRKSPPGPSAGPKRKGA